jgi:hypothetical protein
LEDAGLGLDELPVRVLLEYVVPTAEATEIAAAGQTTLVIGLCVIEVAAPGRLAAGREPAGQIPRRDELLEARRRPVGGSGGRVRAASGGRISGRPDGREGGGPGRRAQSPAKKAIR